MNTRDTWSKIPTYCLNLRASPCPKNNCMDKILQYGTLSKNVIDFPSPAGLSLTKLSLAGNNQLIPGQGEFGYWHPGWGRENRWTLFTVYSVVWGGVGSDLHFCMYLYFLCSVTLFTCSSIHPSETAWDSNWQTIARKIPFWAMFNTNFWNFFNVSQFLCVTYLVITILNMLSPSVQCTYCTHIYGKGIIILLCL